ncbi:MAG: DNA mismatch repair endonuclease MutL [Bacilli bacterium]|nr:DNA mismatch repair endonuclease MutL [Bacilli bacterium]
MGKIEVMSENLANKIAAGEVVEKCMNVVKELVENSIDANSTEIKINLIDSGVKEITVTDNGIGMDKDDALLAFSRHATSKVKSLEDLFYINSLGFRGEALPSIAAVSLVDMKTSNGSVGTHVVIDGGELKTVESSDLKTGTKITVKNLFYNTPVRLKYLRNLYTELANITEYVDKMALSFPNIRFTLINNEKILLNTDGSNSLLKVIGNVYGMDIAKKMIEVNKSNEDYELKGYISYPECAKSSKSNINILVNGRAIKNNEINRIILDSYHSYIPDGKVPIIVLNINVDPILIDVNVHPTKMDIKFSKMDTLKDLLSKTIKEKLEKINLIPEAKPVNYVEHYDYIKDNTFEDNSSKEKEIDNGNKVIEELSLSFENDEKMEVNEEKVSYQSSDKSDEDTLRIKKMYPIGAIDATYIVAENEDGMYLIDQHAAAERINYEKYLDKLSHHDNETIDLLVPIKIELTKKDFIILKEHFDILTEMGFTVEEFGINTIIIRTHPYWIPKDRADDCIRKMIDIITTEEDFSSEKFIDRIAAGVACKASVRAHEVISLTDMEDLLERLRHVKNPFTCAHGRPTIISYSYYELEKMFKRIQD